MGFKIDFSNETAGGHLVSDRSEIKLPIPEVFLPLGFNVHFLLPDWTRPPFDAMHFLPQFFGTIMHGLCSLTLFRRTKDPPWPHRYYGIIPAAQIGLWSTKRLIKGKPTQSEFIRFCYTTFG